VFRTAAVFLSLAIGVMSASCQSLSIEGSTISDLDAPHPRSGSQTITFDSYQAVFAYEGKARNCPSAKDRLLETAQYTGLPDLSSTWSATDLTKRNKMLTAYGNYMLCAEGHYPDDVLAAIAQNTIPWMLSGQSIKVSLNRDYLPGGLKEGLNSPSLSSLRKMTPQESALPHSDVNVQSGLSIGTIFADDEPGKWEEGTRVYEVSEKGPKFIRHFKSLLATELGNKVNFAINLQIDPSDKVELRSEPMQMIVKNGEMQGKRTNFPT